MRIERDVKAVFCICRRRRPNLLRDAFMKRHMEVGGGYMPLEILADFPRVVKYSGILGAVDREQREDLLRDIIDGILLLIFVLLLVLCVDRMSAFATKVFLVTDFVWQ